MMIALTENTASSMSQPMHHDNNNSLHRSNSAIGYDYYHHHHHQNPWEKPHYATFDYSPTPFSMGTISSTGALSSSSLESKANSSFDLASNLNQSTFARRHTESILPETSPNSFNYYHYHHRPSEFFFPWNNHSSFMRTQSASFQHYSQSASYPQQYNSMKSTENATTNPYPSFLNLVPPVNLPFMPLPPPPLPAPVPSTLSTTSVERKRSIPSNRKRPRLTPQLRNEILRIRANRPTIFIWEIQQTLIENRICTPQTLPHATVIQRILNESSSIIKEQSKPHVDLVMKNIFQESSPVTICLSPSQSPALSDGESGSECSICLESYRSGQEVSILSCSHEYHSSCIKEWMMKNRSCPMCRKDIHNQPQFVTLLI